ncbi:MAG: homoserine O-acetyltransferase [Sphingobacteriaceae bacterium]|nr:homoserine O-acetyltransferase [Sphingobacteriaceae bacterium]
MKQKIFKYDSAFKLENGFQLPNLEVAYHTYGTLNKNKDNVIWVCHALTANSDVFDWWKGLFGTNDLFNPKDYFIVCANNLGSCYGTTGPLSVNAYTGHPWFSLFPDVTIRDLVNAHDLLRIHLGIQQIHTVIGGSQGGQQVLEWNVLRPEIFEHAIVIATNAKHSPWGIAFNESQRLAIKADRTYYSNFPNGGEKGLAAARSIALLSYRNAHTYNESQKELHDEKVNDFNAASYQRYQGKKLVDRFNAYSYVTLTNAMDSHNLARNRISIEKSLASISANTLVIGVSSDLLFPNQEQEYIATHLKNGALHFIDSFYGHDGFLLETKSLTQHIQKFYNNNKFNKKKQNNLIIK